MTKEILLFLFGKRVFTLSASDRTALVNGLRSCPITVTPPRIRGDRTVFASSRKEGDRLAALLKQAGLAFECEEKGLPAIVLRYRRRYGLLAGALFFTALLIVSTLFLWSIDVSGNKLLTDEEVLAELKAAGFGVGTFLPKTDYDGITNRLLLASEDIAWLGIEMDGTHARITVRERLKKQADGMDVGLSGSMRAANLISKADGQIFYTTVYDGTTVINPGDSVKKGDLLVSGFREKEDGSFTLGRAAGKVYAFVTRTLTAEIPFEQAEKVETGEVRRTFYVNIFGKSIKLFQKGGKTLSKYDIIKGKHTATVFGAVTLPLSLSEVLEVGYDYRVKTLTKEEAMTMAEERIDQKLSALSNAFEVVEITRETYETEYGVGIAVSVYGVENIAQTQEIYTEQP